MFWEENTKIKTDSLEFRRFLAEQILLPENKWDKRFKQYVQQKENDLLQEIPKRNFEEEQEWDFQRYLKSLDLKKQDLINKKILDLGCGEGEFVKYCLGHGISEDVYGLDVQLEVEEINPGFRKYFLKGNFEEELPIKELDYIISVIAIDAPNSEEIERDIRKILVLVLMAMKIDGEARIFPVRKTGAITGLRTIEFSWKKWIEVLQDLANKKLINYEFKPIDIGVAGNKPDVWLEQVLIIKKRH
jgi:SAM-dependent methyltransferase